MTLRWLPHTADIRVELTGSSLADLLGQASGAVRELLVGQSVVRPQAVRPLSVSGLDDTELDRVVRYRNFKGEDHASPLWQLMRHMVNHSTYHRGQITTMLRQLGHEAVSTDLVVYYRQQQ